MRNIRGGRSASGRPPRRLGRMPSAAQGRGWILAAICGMGFHQSKVQPSTNQTMNSKQSLPLMLLLALASGYLQANPLGTAFTYQGRLFDGGSPANGQYELQLALFNVLAGPGQVGRTLTNSNVAISNGLFTTGLDFGAGSFNGTAYWLEIGVRTSGSADAFTILSPRQPLTPAPYALFAVN